MWRIRPDRASFKSFRTAVAIRGKDGVVFGIEKLVTSKLHEPGSNKRLFTVDRHIGVVSTVEQNGLFLFAVLKN